LPNLKRWQQLFVKYSGGLFSVSFCAFVCSFYKKCSDRKQKCRLRKLCRLR